MRQGVSLEREVEGREGGERRKENVHLAEVDAGLDAHGLAVDRGSSLDKGGEVRKVGEDGGGGGHFARGRCEGWRLSYRRVTVGQQAL